jgi:hypothetical protein
MPSWSRSKRIAWTGLAAMWMLLCMPLISQYLRAHPTSLDEALANTRCVSLDEASAQGRHAPMSHGANPATACGYCSLLAHDAPPLPSAFAHTNLVGNRYRLIPPPTLESAGAQPRLTPQPRAPPRAAVIAAAALV